MVGRFHDGWLRVIWKWNKSVCAWEMGLGWSTWNMMDRKMNRTMLAEGGATRGVIFQCQQELCLPGYVTCVAFNEVICGWSKERMWYLQMVIFSVLYWWLGQSKINMIAIPRNTSVAWNNVILIVGCLCNKWVLYVVLETVLLVCVVILAEVSEGRKTFWNWFFVISVYILHFWRQGVDLLRQLDHGYRQEKIVIGIISGSLSHLSYLVHALL